MLKYKFMSLFFMLKIATCSCSSEKAEGISNIKHEAHITKIGQLDAVVNESSGLTKTIDGSLWTHNDSGGLPIVYKIDSTGKVLDELQVKGATNIDWEDLASDPNGYLYIGDFGNNGHHRKDLKIYKVKGQKTELIEFRYKDQESFPSEDKNFDCEAFFWYNNELHLFSKSWEKKKLITKHYIIPDEAGSYLISPQHSIELNEPVTSADISPDKKVFALLTYGKILFYGIEDEEINFSYPLACIKSKRKQTEALAFDSQRQIIFTNEQRDIYKLYLSDDYQE